MYTEVEHAYINTLTRGDLSSLSWVESPNKYFDLMELPSDVHLCSVYYAPLNFRDIMIASGRLIIDAIPGQLADRDCMLGLEYSGRLANGTRIMGIASAQALATSVIAPSQFFWKVPDKWSLLEAATGKSVALTHS